MAVTLSNLNRFFLNFGSVATYARCGGIYNNHFIANFVENLPVEFFLNRLMFDEVIPIRLVSSFLRDTVYYTARRR